MAKNSDRTVIDYICINGFLNLVLGPGLYQARLRRVHERASRALQSERALFRVRHHRHTAQLPLQYLPEVRLTV